MVAFTKEKCLADFLALKSEMSEWEDMWDEISNYITPARRVKTSFTAPAKRKLIAAKAINTTAEDALGILVSGFQGGFIPSTRPWLRMDWKDKRAKGMSALQTWLEEASEVLNAAFQNTNFYSAVKVAIHECCGFGTGCVFSDSSVSGSPFSIENHSVGEYVFALDENGNPNKLYRVYFLSPANLVEKYGKDRVSAATNELVESKTAIRDYRFVAVIDAIIPEPFQDKKFKRYTWEIGTGGMSTLNDMLTGPKVGKSEPLEVSGFYEFPIHIMRWDILAGDVFGVGPGMSALPEVKRLQEIEKSYRLAVHREVDPPLIGPSYLRGTMSSLPGSKNYYRNPNDRVYRLFEANFNEQACLTLMERIEGRIKLKFFNDIFLTAARDPNASPLKAAEVVMRDGEKMLRLGSVMERVVPEFFRPLIVRCFNIMYRKGLLPQVPPEVLQLGGGVNIEFTSPLAQAQKLVSARTIELSLAFIGQAQAISPTVMDNIDPDKAVEEYFDAHGTPKRIMTTPEQKAQIRAQRNKDMQDEKNKQEAAQAAELSGKIDPQMATAQKTRAETSGLIAEAMQTQQELGGF